MNELTPEEQTEKDRNQFIKDNEKAMKRGVLWASLWIAVILSAGLLWYSLL